jgi:hypothetical protein
MHAVPPCTYSRARRAGPGQFPASLKAEEQTTFKISLCGFLLVTSSHKIICGRERACVTNPRNRLPSDHNVWNLVSIAAQHNTNTACAHLCSVLECACLLRVRMYVFRVRLRKSVMDADILFTSDAILTSDQLVWQLCIASPSG